MRYYKIVFYLLLSICFVSCYQHEEKPKPKIETLYLKKIIIAKTTETVNATALSGGYTLYKLAFSDGGTERTSFGFFSCLQVGDSVSFIKEPHYWDYSMKPSCR